MTKKRNRNKKGARTKAEAGKHEIYKKEKRKQKDAFEDFKEEVQWREGKENVYSVN